MFPSLLPVKPWRSANFNDKFKQPILSTQKWWRCIPLNWLVHRDPYLNHIFDHYPHISCIVCPTSQTTKSIFSCSLVGVRGYPTKTHSGMSANSSWDVMITVRPFGNACIYSRICWFDSWKKIKKFPKGWSFMVIFTMVESAKKITKDDMMHTSNRFGPNTPPS